MVRDVSDPHAFKLVDTDNGVAVRLDPAEWIFPSVDLTVNFHRRPEDHWAGLDVSVTFGLAGRGVTSTVLHDIHGSVGRAEQTHTIRPLKGR
ncbi:hypothetical protein [Kitasatospora sp. NPDC058046]|uniref:hypothetical protein n=1 Tax=Kitasatospora sp. NPDC058046 TaxID=3346312 RepID=UPI0036D92458